MAASFDIDFIGIPIGVCGDETASLPLDSCVMETHQVVNQTPPLADFNPYLRDVALQEAVAREGAAAAHEALTQRGGEIGSAAMIALADAANRNVPALKLFDATGRRRDVVEFHPAYHELMSYLARHGAAAGPWVAKSAGAHAARAALYYLYAQVEDGTLCPTTMTYASVPALREDPALASTWLPRIERCEYDPRFIPAQDKRGVTLGMGMTEKQGGSDVRANTTRAERIGGGARTVSSGTSGSSPRRCATHSSCSRRRRPASLVSSCRASRRTAPSMRFASSA